MGRKRKDPIDEQEMAVPPANAEPSTPAPAPVASQDSPDPEEIDGVPLVKPAESVSSSSSEPPQDDIVSAAVESVKKGPGRPRKSAAKAPKATEADAELLELAPMAMAEAEIGFFTAFGGKTFEQGACGGRDDRKMLESAWRYYFRVNGLKNVPGWVILLIGHLSYVGPRLGVAENRDAIKGFFGKVKGYFKPKPKTTPQPPAA